MSMPSDKQINAARARLESKWDSEGMCASCGWHAALYEHDVTDQEIANALESGGLLRLTCVGWKSHDDCDTHRGVRIFIGESEPC
jgi:hypothetical protein